MSNYIVSARSLIIHVLSLNPVYSRVALKSKMKAVELRVWEPREEVSAGVGNDGFGSGLFLEEPLEAGEQFGSKMGERFGKSQYDIEVVDPFEFEVGNPAVLIFNALLQKL